MGVRKCPKCGSVWYTALVNCAFCGVEGEEVKGPISPAKLNLVHGGVSTAPPKAPEPPPPVEVPPPAEVKEAAPVVPDPVPEVKLPTPVEAPPPPSPEPPVEEPKAFPPPIETKPPPPPPLPERKPERKPLPRLVPEVEPTTPPPMVPSATVPLVFGLLGLVSSLLLPTLGMVQKDRVVVILALLGWAILAPFAPFAWFSGQRYLDQCRALGFAPDAAARTGKALGRLATFLLIFEFSALAVFVAIQALSGKIVCPLWK